MSAPVSGQNRFDVPGPPRAAFNPPDESTLPEGPMGEAIDYGFSLIMETQKFARDYVGNGLNCRNCHLAGGRIPNAMPYVGLSGIYPMYRARSGKVVVLQERINDCFMRSLNGKPLPLDSPEMNGIMAYISWLSVGVPTGAQVEGRRFQGLPPPAEPADPVRGKELFANICSACHGSDGAGQKGGDGFYAIPPLWGDVSYNIGAGMARLSTAAAFVKHNMPLGRGGLLDDRDVYDIASYFTAQPRPDFPLKHLDWPKGGKPADARY